METKMETDSPAGWSMDRGILRLYAFGPDSKAKQIIE
jgi:hypothetical protein